MVSKEGMAMDHSVRNIRQLRRGVEADVTLGIGSVPSASVTMKVVLSPTDPEWRAILAKLDELFARRAEDHVRGVLDYSRERAKRQAKGAIASPPAASPMNEVSTSKTA